MDPPVVLLPAMEWLLFAPLALVFALALPMCRRRMAALIPLLAFSLLLGGLAVPIGSDREAAWLLLGSRLGVDGVSHLFLVFTGLLWVYASVYLTYWLQNGVCAPRFWVSWLLAMAGNFGLIIAQDMLSFLLGFALMSFASYGLISHPGDDKALRAGRVYLFWTMLAEVLLFSGLARAADAADSLLFADIASANLDYLTLGLGFLGFGIKSAVLGLHVWLPLAYPAAPPPAAAVLSGAMINAGLLGWIRFLPLGELELPAWGMILMGTGSMAAVYGTVVGIAQREPKVVLAYSSISQMGLMTAVVGVVLSNPTLWPAVLPALLLYATHHALAKGALFMGMGVWERPASRNVAFFGLALLALVLAGAPLTSGALAKLSLKSATVVPPVTWLLWLLVIKSFGTTLLMARFLYVLRFATLTPATEQGAGILLPWAGLLLAVAVLPWLLAAGSWRDTALAFDVGSLLPLVAGVIVAALVALVKPSWLSGLVGRIPPGDLLVMLEAAWRQLSATTIRCARVFSRPAFARRWSAIGRPWRGPRQGEIELALRRWPSAGLLWLMVFAGLLFGVLVSGSADPW